MKQTKKEPEKTHTQKPKKEKKSKLKSPVIEKDANFKKLVELLQIHQVELEHQNQELRITQEELEVSRNKYVNLFDFSPIPYFTLDTDGIIKEVNLSASKMLGFDRNKLINKQFNSFVQLDQKDIFHLFIKTVFNSSIKNACELKMISKNKNVFDVLLEGLKLDDTLETNQQCQVALIDLTKYKQAENALKKTAEELRLLNNTKDKFFSIIAHDLRSPFQSILSSSEMLVAEVESLSQEDVLLLSRGLNNNLKNLYGLLENLLDWSMMQRKMLEFKPVNLNLKDVVDKIIEMSNQSAIKKNISISNNVDPQTMVTADFDMLRSVIQNLVVNAIKFTLPKGRIIISSVEGNNFVEVSIQDTGIGIEPERTLKLFDFGALLTSNGTTGEKGTGLGLPLCKEFVEKHGGKIWIESKLGEGSKFIFTLLKAV